MTNSDVIDSATLNELVEMVMGDKAFLDELIDTYFEDSPKLLTGLRTALLTNDAGEFTRKAHSLKSNSAGFGAKKLSNLCKELELLGKAGDLINVDPLIVQVLDEYERVRQALLEIRNHRWVTDDDERL